MKKTKKSFLALLLVTMVLVIITGCAKQPQSSADADNYLRYRFENGTNKYVSSSNMNQLLVAGEQEVSADVISTVSYSVTKTGEENNNLKLRIEVDSIYTVVKSAQGNVVSNPDEVKGSEFPMLLSGNGDESGLNEAAKIEYTGLNGETANLKSAFLMLFPDLPDDVIKVGYEWTDNDTIDMSVSEQTVLLIIQSENKITAREKYNGYDCYKIEYITKGERNASGSTPQGYMSSSGDLTGSGYLYFAYKEGIVIEDHNEQKFDGDLVLPTGDALPMYLDIRYDTKLKK